MQVDKILEGFFGNKAQICIVIDNFLHLNFRILANLILPKLKHDCIDFSLTLQCHLACQLILLVLKKSRQFGNVMYFDSNFWQGQESPAFLFALCDIMCVR